MKKVTVWLASVLALIVGLCCLAACGGGVEGTYKFYSMTVGEQTVKAGEEMGGVTISKDYMVLELKKDGNCTVKSAMAGGQEQSGTWKKNDEDENKIEVTVDGETLTFTKDGNKLEASMEGTVIVLKK